KVHNEKELNTRATRTVVRNQVDILPWGAWAEFYNRHFAQQIVGLQRYVKDSLGQDRQADLARGDMTAVFRHLTLFPVATLDWPTGPHDGDAVTTFVNDAISLGVSSPELVTSRPWYFLELATQYEQVKQGMPSGAKWFVPISVRDPYDAG